MSALKELLLSKKHISVGNKASQEEITKKEEALQLKFADEYKEYLAEFGKVSFCRHELTGITSDKRLDVEEITRSDRLFNPNIPSNMYVIEEAYIDDIIYLQNETGKVFISRFNDVPEFAFDSLYEYVKSIDD